MKRFWSRLTIVLLTALGVTAPGLAHDFAITEALLLLRADGTYQLDLTVDVDALALGVSPSTDSAEVAAALEGMSAAEFEASSERAIDTLLRRTRLRFDGEKVLPEISFPELGSAIIERYEVPTVFGTTARLVGLVPEDAGEVTFGASRSFKAVHLTILDQTSLTGARHLLDPGADSPAHGLGAPAEGAAPVATTPTGWRYLVLGFEHIVPKGVDHILFVLGLFLLSVRLRPLLWQITAFTVAHSVTLALSIYDVFSLPSRPVETLIALSIAYVAFENLATSELKPWRTALVFGFGLLHGLGFAGVLRELGLPRDEFFTALVGFNVGVELGQLAVVLAALLLVGRFRQRPWYRARVVMPASLLIGLVGLYWAVERGFGL